jgi:ABC-type Co2+ transport system permease subunit
MFPMITDLMMGLTQSLLKYVVQGLAVALAAYYIPNQNMAMTDVVMIALTAGATFLVLDMFAPSVGASARAGAGLGIGLNQVGFTRAGAGAAAAAAMQVPVVEGMSGGAGCGAMQPEMFEGGTSHDMVNY